MLFWLTIAFLVGAAIAIYVAYAKIRSGQQPGEPFIDAMLARIKRDRAPQPSGQVPPIPNPGPLPTPPPTYPTPQPAPVVWDPPAPSSPPAPILTTTGPPIPYPSQTMPTPPPPGGAVPAMNPASNAYLLDPALGLPDTSPEGYGLYYQIGLDRRPVPGTVPTLSYGGSSSFRDAAEIEAFIAASGHRDAALDRWAEEWKAQTFNGPIAANPLPPPGDLAYAAGRVGDYHAATSGRDLFRDLFAGTNPEIAHARNIANAHVNQGLPYDQGLLGVIDSLIERHRS